MLQALHHVPPGTEPGETPLFSSVPGVVDRSGDNRTIGLHREPGMREQPRFWLRAVWQRSSGIFAVVAVLVADSQQLGDFFLDLDNGLRFFQLPLKSLVFPF